MDFPLKKQTAHFKETFAIFSACLAVKTNADKMSDFFYLLIKQTQIFKSTNFVEPGQFLRAKPTT